MSTEDTIKGILWGDLALLGLSWENGGRDVALRVLVPGPEPDAQRERLVVFRWAAHLVVRLEFGEGCGGSPLTWDVSFEHTADGRWNVLFDFAHAGEVRLSCAEIELVPPGCVSLDL